MPRRCRRLAIDPGAFEAQLSTIDGLVMTKPCIAIVSGIARPRLQTATLRSYGRRGMRSAPALHTPVGQLA